MEATHLQSAFVCLFVCHLTQAGFSHHLLAPCVRAATYKCGHTFRFMYFSWNCHFCFMVFSWKQGNGCLGADRINPFSSSLMVCIFPPIHYFYFRNIFALKLSNKLFLSLEASDFRIWTSMVPNLQTLSCLTYSASFSIGPLLINHSTSDKANNKFFCWDTNRNPSTY